MLKGFRDFILRGNVIDLAIGIIIGAAFGKIVTSFVSDIIMPPIGLILGKVDFASLFINLSGSLFLGWFSTVLTQKLPGLGAWLRTDDLRLMIAVGFTGAYTTFSTFEYETHDMLDKGDNLAAAAYVAGSVFLGLVAVRFGVRLANWH